MAAPRLPSHIKAAWPHLSYEVQRGAALDEELDRINVLLEGLVTAAAPQLLDLHGVGPDTAATLLVAAGDNAERIRTEAAWANLCGVAPLPASSGRTTRYRLNRGGNRRANHALCGS